MLRVDGVRRGSARASPQVGHSARSTETVRARPALVQRPALLSVWSGRGPGLPRRLPVLLQPSASAALGPPQNVMLEAGARDRAKILRPRGVREGSVRVPSRGLG